MGVTDAPLRSLRIQEQGNRVAVGDENGSVTLLKLSEALSHLQKEEKSACSALFERETRREKVLEAKARELKLKEKEKNRPKVEEEEADDPLAEVQEEFENTLQAEQKKWITLDKALF